MQKLEINWKKVEKVQAEAIAREQERNGEDKQNSSLREKKIWLSFLFLSG